ncbi:hypothetical protein FRB95_010122 [Tulasnella sp. JGI-2019a]|nr:hypothetical protein FRB95_010122 [Tulasnella sp. JGI-2019a]
MWECLKSVSETKITAGHHDDALAFLSQAYAIFKELDHVYDETIDCTKCIAKISANRGIYEDTFTWLGGKWTVAIESDSWKQYYIVKAVYKLLDLWRESNQPTSMNTELEELPDVLNETRRMVDSLCHTAGVHFEKSLYKEAMESFGDAHRLLKGLEGGWGNVDCLRGLSAVLEKQEDVLKLIQSLVRLARVLGPMDIPGPEESELTQEGDMVVLRAGKLLRGLKDHAEAPEQLRIEVAQLHVCVAIAFRARLRHREARSTLLEASEFLQWPGEQLQIVEKLLRLENALFRVDCIRQAVAVQEERNRVQVELHEKMSSNDWLEVAWRRVWQWRAY